LLPKTPKPREELMENLISVVGDVILLLSYGFDIELLHLVGRAVAVFFRAALGSFLPHLVQLLHRDPLLGVVGQLFINEVLELGLVHSLFEGVLVQKRDVRVPGQVVLREHLRLHVEADFVEQHLLVLLLLLRVLYLLVL